MLNLLQRDIESYLAVKTNQENYDITIVLNTSCVKRVQVKSTNLQNDSTNNSLSGTDKIYDYLVLVILGLGKPRCFILTKEEADLERGASIKFACSKKDGESYLVRNSLLKFENQWDKIKAV